MRRIAGYREPDADAIAAARLAEAYLFTDEDVEVVFVPRCRPGTLAGSFDRVVEVSNAHDPQRLVFDHKPPVFADRNATCAARLVWEHLMGLGCAVAHRGALLRVVHKWAGAARQAVAGAGLGRSGRPVDAEPPGPTQAGSSD